MDNGQLDPRPAKGDEDSRNEKAAIGVGEGKTLAADADNEVPYDGTFSGCVAPE